MGFIESIKHLFVKRNDLKCPLCSKIFSTSEEFDNHMKSDHKYLMIAKLAYNKSPTDHQFYGFCQPRMSRCGQ